jgi:uncharacterized membrane protein YagU involved in acid resistance
MASESHTTPHHEHAGPDGVEMPRPTVAPLFLGFGLTLLAAGLAFGTGFLVVGAVVLIAALCVWIANILPGRGHIHEPLAERAQRAPAVAPAPGSVEHLRAGIPGYRLRLPEDVHPISAGVKGGIAGGVVMPVPALIWGLVSSHHSLWYPINLLAGIVLTSVGSMSDAELEHFQFALFVVAIVIHVILSLVIGLIYGVLLPTLPEVPRPISWGGLLMPIVWTAVSYVAMNIVNPELPGKISWPWFILSQFVYGIVMPSVVLGAKRWPPVLAGAIGGLVGGGAMAVPAVLWAAASQHGFWYPINVLAGIVLSGPGQPDADLGHFHADWFIAASVMHIILSIVFGVLFALLARRLPLIPGPLAWGGLVLPMVWTGLSYGLMDVVNPLLQGKVDWFWFIISQFLFGVAAAVVVLRSEMIHIPPAGRGPDRAADFVTGEREGGS